MWRRLLAVSGGWSGAPQVPPLNDGVATVMVRPDVRRSPVPCIPGPDLVVDLELEYSPRPRVSRAKALTADITLESAGSRFATVDLFESCRRNTPCSIRRLSHSATVLPLLAHWVTVDYSKGWWLFSSPSWTPDLRIGLWVTSPRHDGMVHLDGPAVPPSQREPFVTAWQFDHELPLELTSDSSLGSDSSSGCTRPQ